MPKYQTIDPIGCAIHDSVLYYYSNEKNIMCLKYFWWRSPSIVTVWVCALCMHEYVTLCTHIVYVYIRLGELISGWTNLLRACYLSY